MYWEISKVWKRLIQNIDFELSYYKSLQAYLMAKGNDYGDIIAPSIVGLNDGFLNGLIKV